MVTRPCSITSWMAVRSMSDILSNSSMHTTPRSASTMAPASRRRSPRGGGESQSVSARAKGGAADDVRHVPVSWSVVTAAVRPTPEEPRPVVGMALGAV